MPLVAICESASEGRNSNRVRALLAKEHQSPHKDVIYITDVARTPE
jgi:hypothetical protein